MKKSLYLPLPLTNYSMNEYEIITDPQVIEEAFRQDQEAEDAPVPDKVQDILTNTLWAEEWKK